MDAGRGTERQSGGCRSLTRMGTVAKTERKKSYIVYNRMCAAFVSRSAIIYRVSKTALIESQVAASSPGLRENNNDGRLPQFN